MSPSSVSEVAASAGKAAVGSERLAPRGGIPTKAPYKGMLPYGDTEEDARFFFGRETEREIISANLLSSRLTLLYGASGTGKSSVLAAGVVYHLRRQAREEQGSALAPEYVIAVVRTWHCDPIEELTSRVREAIEAAVGRAPAEPPRQSDLRRTLEAWSQEFDIDLLIILDQFDEYFLYHARDVGPGSFAEALTRCINSPKLRANFLISIRDDFYSRLDRFKGHIPSLYENYLRIDHLDNRAAEEAIRRPIELYNELHSSPDEQVTIDNDLVKELLVQLRAGRIDVGHGGTGTVKGDSAQDLEVVDRVEAPYLQLVMNELWREEMRQGSRRLRRVTLVDRLGGAKRIVRNHLDRMMKQIGFRERDIAARVLRRLVTRSGTKIAHGLEDLQEFVPARQRRRIEPILSYLCQAEARILRRVEAPGGSAGATRYEIAHDMLAEPVLEWSRKQDERRQLRKRASIAGAVLAVIGLVVGLLFNNYRMATEAAQIKRDQELSQQKFRVAQLETEWEQEKTKQAEKREKTERHLRVEAETGEAAAQALLLLSKSPEASLRKAVEAAMKAREGVGDVAPEASRPDSPAIGRIRPRGSVAWNEAETALRQSLLGSRLRSRLAAGDNPQPLADAVFRPDGTILAAGQDGKVRLHDAMSPQAGGRVIEGPPAIQGPINSLACSDDGTRIAVAVGDRAAKGARGWAWIGDLAGGTPVILGDEKGFENPVVHVAFSPDGKWVATAGYDGTARLWEAASGSLQRELQHEARVNRVVFSSDSSHLLTASGDTDSANPASQGETLVYDVLASPETPVQLPNDYPVACAASNQDASIIAVGATDGSVALYRRKAGGATSEYSPKNLWAHTSAVTDIAFNPDGSRLVSTSVDRTAVIWNARSGRQVATLRGHTATIQRAAYRPDGMLIATAGYDGAVRLWDAGTGDSVAVLEGHLAPVSSITFGRDGSRLLTAGRDGSIRVWDASRGAQLQERVQGSRFAGLLAAGASPDGSLFVTAGADGIARVWDGDWKPLNEPIQHSGPVLGVAFSPDSRLVATAGGDGLVHVREARTGSPVCAPLQHPGPVTGVAFDPKQGQYILTACRDNQMRVWVVEAGKERLSVPGNTERVNPRMFSPDAATIVVPSAGVIGFRSAQGAARIWDTKRGGSLGVLRWGSGPVADATFSQAGDRIALAHPGASEATVWHWDGSQYVHDRTFKTATGPIRVAFDRDASRVATESEDGVGTIWDVRAERPSHSYFGLVGPTPIIGFGSAGGKFLGDSGIGVGQVFDLDAGSSPSLVGGRRSMLHAALLRDSDNSAFAVEHGGTLVRWNTLSGMPTVVSSQTQHFVVTAAAFSANGQFVVIAGGKGDIVVQDTDGKKPPVIIRYTGFVSRAAVNSGGRQLALAGMDFKVRLLDTSMLTQVRSVLSQVEFAASPSRVMTLAHDDHVNSIEFNHDGTRLLTSEGDVSPVRLGARATARIYSLDRGGSEGNASPEPIRVLNWPEDEASASNQDTADDVARGANVAIYSHSGKYILTAVGDGRLPAGSGRAMLWDAAGGDRPIGIYARHAEPILDAAFSPRDDRIVTTSADNSALVWDIADGGAAQGKVLSTLRGHTGNVDAASFSPDERFVLTVSKEDGSARVWEAASGDLIYTLRGLVSDFYRQELTHFGGIRRPLDDVNTAEWLQRGEGILTANGDGFARVYSCQECGELQALLTLAKQRISQKAPIK